MCMKYVAVDVQRLGLVLLSSGLIKTQKYSKNMSRERII